MTSIAIVGLSVELPSGKYSPKNLDHDAFFQLLLDGVDTYERMPAGRFNADAWLGQHLGEIQVDTGAFLKDIDSFDNVEFGVSTKDAHSMAPATRRLLENAFLALLDSGVDYRSRNVGCFTSATAFDLTTICEPDEYDGRGSFAGYPSMVANRISTHLDLLGPSVPTDTACSSTLTAFHLAVQAISQGDCETAVVAGCQLNHRFIDWFTYSQASILAADGKCKPFDASADGFSRGEGCVAVVLKPLDRALQDHDRVYATVLGTSINSAGGAAPPGAPVAEAQRAAMRQAFTRANRSFRDVDYVEVHATGTAKGDPTEVNWVGEESCRDDELLLGSVKGNIGHTEIVAFLASLCKVISVFKTGTIPPAANLRTLNPAIEWHRHKLRVPLTATQLPCRNGKLPLVSIASSGIGGSNGHVVLEGPPVLPAPSRSAVSGSVVLMACGLSSRSATSIGQSLESLLDSEQVDLRALSTVVGRRAKQMTWRSYAVVEEGSSGCVAFSAPRRCSRMKPPVVFLFSGQGPQHPDMGRELFDNFPVFRDSVLEMDSVFMRLTGRSIIRDHGLFAGTAPAADGTWPISLILPSIAIFQMALFDLLAHLGVKPDIVIGHSAGETSVLYASGAAPKAMAVELAVLRGQTFSSMEALAGTMAAVSCTPDEAQRLIDHIRQEDDNSVLDIACYNSPSAIAISGHAVAIDRFMELAVVHGYFCRKIRTRVPIHSSMMEQCRDEYVKALHDLFKRYPGRHVPDVTTYSTYTGTRFEGPYSAEYFWNNTRNPVLFTQAVQEVAHASPTTTIEISPHPVLSSYVSQITQDAGAIFSSTRRRKQGRPSTEHRDLLELCGQLTSVGHNFVDFTALNGRACHELNAPLPEYPFLRKSYPLYPDTIGGVKHMRGHSGPLNHDYLKVNKETHPTLAEHVIRGEPIMPAAGFIEMALEFGATALMDVDMRAILSLSSEKPAKVDISRDGFRWVVKTSISSSHPNSATPISILYVNAILDACLHITSFRPFHGDHSSNGYYLPAHVDAVILHRSPRVHFFPDHIYTHTILREWTPSSVFYDITITDDAGSPLCTLQRLEVAKHHFNPPPEDLIPFQVVLQHPTLSPRPVIEDKAKVNGHHHGNGKEDHLTDAIVNHSGALQEAVKEISDQDSRRVARILVVGTDFPHLFFDISIPKGTQAHINIDPRRRTVRTSNIDLAKPHPEPVQSFDLVSLFLPEGELHAAQLNRLLVSGGSLVVTTRLDLPVNGHKTHGLEKLSQTLRDAGLTVRRTLVTPDGSSSIVLTWRQKISAPAGDAPESPVFNPEEAFVFHYSQGHEVDLQWDFSGLDPAEPLDVWVLTSEGRGGGAALGLVRALRLEYLLWTIRVVIFPSSYEEDACEECLHTIPTCMREELDIFVTQDGGVLVPRMVPLPERTTSDEDGVDSSVHSHACEDYMLLNVRDASDVGDVTSVVGVEVKGSELLALNRSNDGTVIALVQGIPTKVVGVRREASSRLSPRLEHHSAAVVRFTPGVVAAALAQGTHTFNNVKRCKNLQVLVTHADTSIGSAIVWTYQRQNIAVVGVPADATPLQLSSALRSGFNLIVSGYTDASYIELLKFTSTSKDRKIYLWNDPHEGLPWSLQNDLWSVQDALELVLAFLEVHVEELGETVDGHSPPQATVITSANKTPAIVAFSPHRTYLVLGGIGNLGAHVTLMLYRHGARHIIVTSRRGAASLQTTSNRLVRRTFEYLQSLPELDLRLSATSASDVGSMTQLLRTISDDAPLAGCIILTATLADRTFARLEEADFAEVYESKTGVVDALRESADIASLDFLVPFTSVAGLFGNGGQTNYCAANTAMEEQVSAYSNAFAFVCPGIIDSAMMRASDLSESGKTAQLEQFAQWGITAEDMVLWLEDALGRFQTGERFARYVPTVDWYAVERTRGMPIIGRHILSSDSLDDRGHNSTKGVGEGGAEDAGAQMAAIVRGVLGVSAEDFSPETPFTAYGVDSLSAARLAFMLRPYVEVTQLQLLADMSLRGLEKLAGTSAKENEKLAK
ncbi:putative polyketide synthase [Rhodofomes roseus]|uniref:Polyketide synthase n=1 Tax=Rhodofomes roseus TaxID=34475 RepID=A0ABQ8KQQ9_9APHY|nr:putative polyketide synthase [Rhodofomes roseus]KAH9840916.1 putative polyketide synthase [Rhodofomes roseus]